MYLDHILPLLSFFSSLYCPLLHLSHNFMASFVVISNPLSKTRALYMNMSVASCIAYQQLSSDILRGECLPLSLTTTLLHSSSRVGATSYFMLDLCVQHHVMFRSQRFTALLLIS